MAAPATSGLTSDVSYGAATSGADTRHHVTRDDGQGGYKSGYQRAKSGLLKARSTFLGGPEPPVFYDVGDLAAVSANQKAAVQSADGFRSGFKDAQLSKAMMGH